MFDFIVVVFFELLLLVLVVGTLREWWKSRRHVELLPIAAYVLSMLSFPGPLGSFLHPWIAGFVWLAVGVVMRVAVRRRKKAD